MRVGYVRVSTVDQLDGIAVERVFTDTASGKDAARPKLDELLAFVRDGDTVTVHSMDRLARNLERQREGIAAAKQRGAYTGRKPALTAEQARRLRERAAAGERKSVLAREFGISRETVYSYLRAVPVRSHAPRS